MLRPGWLALMVPVSLRSTGSGPAARETLVVVQEAFCYLTTRGRVTGRPHTIEIWFALEGDTVFMLSGSRTSDWVRNIEHDPSVTVRIATRSYPGRARIVSAGPEGTRARDLVAGKYQPTYAGDLSGWKQGSTVVAVDLEEGPAGD